jgi:hypothetical protein
MTTKTEYNIDCFNKGCEQNYFKIYKEFLYDVVIQLKQCKYAYDGLKKVGVFNDDDDKIYVFDKLIKYYYDKMNDKCYSGVIRKCNELLDNPKCIKYRYEGIDCRLNKICPKLQKRENNEIIKSLIQLVRAFIRRIEVEIRRYTDEDFCSMGEIIYIPDPEYQEFKKVQPSICEKKTIFKKINRDLYNRIINTDSKKYIECFGIGIENVNPDDDDYPDYPDDDDYPKRFYPDD